MPRPRSAMRKIKEVLRLTFAEGLSRRRVAAAVGLPYTTVCDQLSRARQAGLGWPLPDELDDRALEERLFPAAPPRLASRSLPAFAELHAELRRPGVTLALLHLEYKQGCPEGYQYSQFAHLYRLWEGRLDPVMRQEHRAGEKLFVDFAGQTLPITNPLTGEVTRAQLFVAVLGASNYTYAEALFSQELPHWIGAHVRAFAFIGGCTQQIVPDNLKSAVTRAHRYEPVLNRTFEEFALHYRCVILPARPYKSRDKAKVEVGVQVAERWILAALRNRTFFSLAEANRAISELLERLNARPFKKLPGSRASWFREIDQPALRPLPAEPYQYGEWQTDRKVSIDYHLEADHHYYSVPYALIGERCDVRLAAATVEIFHKGKRVTSHLRSYQRGGHTTLAEHMPSAHRRHAEWTPGRIVGWAEQTGPQTAALVERVMSSRPHPEQGFRSCLGIMRLGRQFGDQRLEAAAARALAIRSPSYRSVESILKNNLDRQALAAPAPPPAVPAHANLRGPDYYR